MAKFLGGVRLDVNAKHGFMELKSGDDYNLPDETQVLVADMLALAKEYEMQVAAFIPEFEGGEKEGAATTWTDTQLAKAIAKGRTPAIFQGKRASFPAPYLALIMPKADDKAKAKPAKTGPDLSRKAKTEQPAGPNLSRKK